MRNILSEYIEDGNGGHFVDHVYDEEFPESEGRHDDLCVVCGFPDYPECREWCPNEETARGKSQE